MPYTTLFRSDRHHPHRPRQVPPRNASPDAHSSSRGTESRTPARASDRSPCRSWPDHRYGGRVVLDSKAYLNSSRLPDRNEGSQVRFVLCSASLLVAQRVTNGLNLLAKDVDRKRTRLNSSH